MAKLIAVADKLWPTGSQTANMTFPGPKTAKTAKTANMTFPGPKGTSLQMLHGLNHRFWLFPIYKCVLRVQCNSVFLGTADKSHVE